jgi:hypothetical protein
VGAYLQSLAGAVAFHANVAVAVAALAGLEVSSGLYCMIRGPLVGGEKAPRMAGLALCGSEEGMVRTDVAQFYVPELSPVGLELEILAAELGMAL